VKDNRPVYLNLFQYKFPATAIASVLHRISGLLVFLFIPLLLWMLEQSLSSTAQFQAMQQLFNFFLFKLLIWVTLAAILFHLVAGIRHVLMDMGWGESKTVSRVSAYLVMVVAAVLIILTGIWLW